MSFTTLQILSTWRKTSKQRLILTRLKTGERFIVKRFNPKNGVMQLQVEGSKQIFLAHFTSREEPLYRAHYETERTE